MLLVIMGIMSGCRSYYALEDFGVRHYEVLCEKLGLTLSPTTIRHDVSASPAKIRFCDVLAQQFEQWAKDNMEMEPGEGVAIDGKSIKSTVGKSNADYHSFVGMVSVYSQRQGVVLALQPFDSKSTSEVKVEQKLLEALALLDVVVTLDALLCQKYNAVSC